MSRNLQLPSVPLLVLKVSKSPGVWKSKPVEGNDVLFLREAQGSHLVEYRAVEFFESIFSAHSVEDVTGFLRLYDHPGTNEDEYVGTRTFRMPSGEPFTLHQHINKPRSRVFLTEIRELQQLLKQAIDTPLDQWRREWFDRSAINIELENFEDKLVAVCRFNNGVDACLAYLYLEKITRDISYGWCTRCGKPYRKKSKHHRKYCDDCPHAAAQAAYRSRAKKQAHTLAQK
jgi:hypothetical protein